MIHVNNISKSYGELQAVHEVSFDISEGEIVGFLGPNGAGKSTTLKILAGVLTPDSGSVELYGKDISLFPIECKHRIGYLPEDNPLYGWMYVKEYLEYVGGIYLSKGEIKQSVDEMVECCGLKKEYRKKIETLSKGNRQRVGLAQALIHKPDFLILDEPTGGLDPNQQEEMLAVIKSYSKEKQVLLSTHSLSEAKNICSRILIIHEGKIRANEQSEKIDSLEEMFFELTK